MGADDSLIEKKENILDKVKEALKTSEFCLIYKKDKNDGCDDILQVLFVSKNSFLYRDLDGDEETMRNDDMISYFQIEDPSLEVKEEIMPLEKFDLEDQFNIYLSKRGVLAFVLKDSISEKGYKESLAWKQVELD